MGRLYQFGEFQINVGRRALLRAGAPMAISARAFDLLLVLVEQRHRVVDKDELLGRVWPDQVVEEGNLTQQIFVLRRLVGDARVITTVPRRGYQFTAAVEERTERSHGTGQPASARPLRLELALDPPILLGANCALAVAPDGGVLVYVGPAGDTTALFARELDGYTTRQIAGTDGATAPFLAPDGRWVGFASAGLLHRVSIDGGTPLAICEVEGTGRGASWSRDNLIAFAPHRAGPLLAVAATGGTPRPLTHLRYEQGERSHRFPAFTPDGRHVIFTIASAGDTSFSQARIAVTAVEAAGHRILIDGGSCGRVDQTTLVYQRDGTIFVAPFDMEAVACAAAGDPREPVAVHDAGAAHVATTDDGVRFYAPPAETTVPSRLVWCDGDTEETLVDEVPGIPEEPRLSPDGTKLVIGIRRGQSDLWLYDLTRRTLSRLTESGDNFAAIWSKDGRFIVFSSNRGGPSNLFRLPLGSQDLAAPLLESPHEHVPGSWTPDGQGLVFTAYHPETNADLWLLPAGGDPQPLIRTRFNEFAPTLSPDGRWLAYTSDASGAFEVYLVRFPALVDRQQVSRDGGTEPVWSADGTRLFYRTASAIVCVDVSQDGAAPSPREIRSDPYVRGSLTGLSNYDVASDGRLLMVTPPLVPTTRTRLHVVISRRTRNDHSEEY